MKIDFDGIQAFVLIAEVGGFGKAAERLHLTQTALTRRIQKLESYIGVRSSIGRRGQFNLPRSAVIFCRMPRGW